MSTTAHLNSAALLILRQTSVPVAPTDKTPSTGDNLLAAANGVSIPSVSGVQSQAKAKITNSLFDNPVDIQKMKVDLMRRLGDELGINLDDFDRPAAFASAVREAISKIKVQPEGAQMLAALEKKLGLDKLGVSLDDLVDAISSPDGEAARKLDAALRKETGEDARDAVKGGGGAELRGVKTDETGLYGF